MKINDTRDLKNTVNVGDFLLDLTGEMSIVVAFNGYGDFHFGVVSLFDFDVIVVDNDLDDLLDEFKSEYGLKEVIPQEKISLEIS